MRFPVAQAADRVSLLNPLVLVIVGAVTASVCNAGEFNRVLSLGDSAPKWDALPSVVDNKVGLDDYSERSVVVVAFTCNSCPYAVDVQERLVALQTWLSENDGQLLAINVNTVDEDLLPKMKERAEEAGFNFPYLFDETQEIARRYGATTTPEFYVLDRDRKVRYMGSLDDSPDGKDVKTQYVRDAVEQVLESQDVKQGETVPIGCRIRFERKRRGR